MEHPRHNRFLVAVDFSRLTIPTIKHAVKLAGGSGELIDLLHVVRGNLSSAGVGHAMAKDLMDQLRKGEEEGAGVQLETLMDQHVPKSIRGVCIVTRGHPAEAINKMAATKDRYSMAVVSTNGRTGLQHMLLGSVAEQVVRRATIPVLVVR